MKRRAGIFASVILLAVSAFGGRLTVQEAMDMAVKNNKDIRKAMLEVEKSRLGVNKAWKSAYFKISYNASALMYFKEIENSFTGSYNRSYTHNISLTQPLYTGGALKTGIEIGKEVLSLAELNMDRIRKETILDTVQAYIDVYEAQSGLEVLEKSREALLKNYEVQKEKYSLRMVTKPEFIEAERSLKAIEAAIIEQKSGIEIAKESLGIIIGYPDSADIEIVPFGVEKTFTQKVNLKNDLDKLEYENTEYQIALRQKEIAGKTVKIKKAEMGPTVAGVVTYGTSNRTRISEVAKTKSYNGTVGLNFSWDIFDWGARRNEVESARKEHEIKEIEAEKVLEGMKVNMKKVYYQLQALEKSLEAKRTAVEKAEEVYELEQERYRYNLITMKSLLDAEAVLRESRNDYANTQLRYYYLVSRYGAFMD